MAPAGRQGYLKATIGTNPKDERVDHNWTTSSKEDRICYFMWMTGTRGLSYNWWVLEVYTYKNILLKHIIRDTPKSVD